MLENSRPDAMTAREAAAFLKAHVRTLRRRVRRGEIPAFKMAGGWRFHKKALSCWLQGLRLTIPEGNHEI